MTLISLNLNLVLPELHIPPCLQLRTWITVFAIGATAVIAAVVHTSRGFVDKGVVR